MICIKKPSKLRQKTWQIILYLCQIWHAIFNFTQRYCVLIFFFLLMEVWILGSYRGISRSCSRQDSLTRTLINMNFIIQDIRRIFVTSILILNVWLYIVMNILTTLATGIMTVHTAFQYHCRTLGNFIFMLAMSFIARLIP